jgi:hypothetical protein
MGLSPSKFILGHNHDLRLSKIDRFLGIFSRCRPAYNSPIRNFVCPATFQVWRNERKKIVPLIYVVGVLIVVGVLLWLVNTYIPMDGKIKSILNAVVVIAVVIYLLQIFGLLGTLQNIKVGHIAGT